MPVPPQSYLMPTAKVYWYNSAPVAGPALVGVYKLVVGEGLRRLGYASVMVPLKEASWFEAEVALSEPLVQTEQYAVVASSGAAFSYSQAGLNEGLVADPPGGTLPDPLLASGDHRRWSLYAEEGNLRVGWTTEGTIDYAQGHSAIGSCPLYPEAVKGGVAGTVKQCGATGLVGVTVNIGATPVVTTEGGAYSLAGLTPGDYIVTPEGDYVFDPVSATVTVAAGEIATADFTADCPPEEAPEWWPPGVDWPPWPPGEPPPAEPPVPDPGEAFGPALPEEPPYWWPGEWVWPPQPFFWCPALRHEAIPVERVWSPWPS